jgi:hypothetical protein
MSNDLESVLPQALQQLGHQAPVTELDASRVRRSVRRRQLMISAPVAAVLAVVVILASVVLSRPGPGHSAAGPRGSACAPLQTGPIPVWARAGFTGNGYPPFAYSRSGDLVAIVFGDPLTAPSAGDHNNKILWVARAGGFGNLVITGHLEGTDRTVTVDTGTSPGPSIVDMPAPGCWHLDLSWGDQRDSIDLRWVGP